MSQKYNLTVTQIWQICQHCQLCVITEKLDWAAPKSVRCGSVTVKYGD